MRIIIDAMGGDNAPAAPVEGVVRAKSELGDKVKFTLVGDSEIIKKTAADMELSLDGIDIVHTTVTISMDESPIHAVKSKSESSMSIGMKMLKPDNGYGDVGDAFLSAGSTGALHLASSIFVGRIPGVRRSCIAALLPFPTPTLLMDSGANTQVTEDYLLQWSVMGSVYMKYIMGVDDPRTGLLNNGAEETKGTELYVRAHRLLRDSSINFVGNVEARDIPFGACDVLVCDGFTGNITLKLIEGMGSFMMKTLKGLYMTNALTKLSSVAVKPHISKLKKSFDSSEHGGAPFIGLKSPVIKAHGSSDAKAIYNAVRQAISCVELDIVGTMEKELSNINMQ